ncbi:MAG: methylated-DNA--[protein]-cysteine S-methyltransferase [Saprospiraceae bacterium]|nr:methylated-DNA--[protein]-cysteine S-methyltransferase [Saprospiraceae bacterium]
MIQLRKFDSKISDSLFYYEELHFDFGNLCLIQLEDGIVCSSFFSWEELAKNSRIANLHGEKIRKKTALMNIIEKNIFQFQSIELKLWVVGTDFQISVWNELLKIPYGKTSTYIKIANAINNPGSVRAVGAAIGSNEHAFLIPCHRVLYNNGESGNFKWGSDRKKSLIQYENPALKFQQSLFE